MSISSNPNRFRRASALRSARRWKATARRACARSIGSAACWRSSCRPRRNAPAVPISPGDAPADHVPHAVAEDEASTLGRALVETVEDHELIDPTLSSERLLYRLFHEQGVRVFPAHAVTERCTCSRDRILKMLRGFDLEERRAMVADDGSVTVTCEFCSRRYPHDDGDRPWTGRVG